MAPAFSPQSLRTVQVIPLTAFDVGGELALEPMRTLTERLLEAGVRLFLPCAGSAEFHSLATEEIVAAIQMTREVVQDAAVILAPVGRQLQEAFRLAELSLDAGADGLLVMPLDFPYLSDAGARDYYHALLDRFDCPITLYKKAPIPTDSLLLELAGHPRMVSVKYAENDIDALQRIVRDDGGRIEWICGSAERFAPFFMLAGATGFTSAAANLCPRLSLAMLQAIQEGDWDEALRLQQIIRPIEEYRARSGNSYNIAFLKYAMKHVGLDFGHPRPPQRRLTPGETREIDAMLPPILEAEQARTPAAAR